jgi:positive regulator of sigma E activity
LVDIILLRTGWIWIAGAVLGAGLGYYLARQHRKARASGRGTRDDRNTP